MRSSQLNRSQTFAEIRMNEFFEYFYNNKLWEFKGTENHPNLGRIDVYQIQDNASYYIRNEKQFQIDNAYQGNHHHSSQQVLPNYRQEKANGLPKWLPFTVGVKTTNNVSQLTADKLKQQIESNLERYWNYHPEFNRVFGYQQNGNELKVFIELQGTLEQDIQQRAAEHRPFQEELLWKMLYSLVRASHKLNTTGQSLNDIRPSRVYYNQYQLSVIPFGIAQEKDQAINYKFQSGENVFFHQDCVNDFQNFSQLNQTQQQSLQYSNEAFQIGMTVLCAGLLRTESEVNVNRNRQYNASELERLLNDFGTIYQSQGRLLQYTLEEFFLRGTRQSPSSIWNIFSDETDHFIFLEPDLQHHLTAQYQENGLFTGRRQRFLQSNPNNLPSLDFKRAYPNHYYYELRKIDYDTRLQSIQTNNMRVRSELGNSNVVRQSSQSPLRGDSEYEKTKHASHHQHYYQPQQNTTTTVVRTSNTYNTSGSQILRASQTNSGVNRVYY